MTEHHSEDARVLRRAQRIPLDIVVTATGDRTSGVMVCVLASDLDAYEQRITDLTNLAASVAGWFEDAGRHFDAGKLVDDGNELHDEAEAIWDRSWLIVQEFDEQDDADERAAKAATSGGPNPGDVA